MEYFLVAEIISTFNKEGFLTIKSYSDFPDRFFELDIIFIEIFGDKKKFFVEKVEKLKNFFIIKLKNFNSDKDVEFLVGKNIFVDSENLVNISNGFYFIHDIIGSKVIRNNIEIGSVTDVLVLPANDVYVIKKNNGEELLIPAISDYIAEFDSHNKILTLKPGEDIYEDE